ncbi:nuclear transport factor 2 family protein [Peterkaempfera sp. SMS 1(5)a]|uniref:nuclear transport factor 2 family protein n=1 Tax=Peterkaempfera podocarpi TaxID=3232308 RepID=UPI003670D500
MSDLKELVVRYLAIWNEADPERREQAVAELWAEDGTYTDPLADVSGRAGIAAVVAAAREQFPGFAFRLAGEVDTNHHIARFRWELVPDGGGDAPVVGFDVAVADADGRLKSVYGFLDRVPSV